jgi:1D-myo-inositol 3-kinase
VTTPDFVVVGHVVQDLAPDGWTLGGTVTFAAVQAQRLGYSVGIVTRAGDDVDVASHFPFARVAQGPSPRTTQFENVYTEEGRRQRVPSRAAAVERGDVPEAWRAAPVVLLGPVLGELEPGFASAFDASPLVAVSAQGWLRALDDGDAVVPTAWTGEPFWRGCDVLFVSDEDLAGRTDELERWTRDVPVVAMTESRRGVSLCAGGRWRHLDAFPETEVDPTGAGDTFAAAFLIRLRETGDAEAATRFGAAAASVSVGGVGAAAMPWRHEVEERLAQYPEVVLR